jgi:amino-acid N-acetyltransferase
MISSIAPESLGPELRRLLAENDLPTSDLADTPAEFYVSRAAGVLLGMVGLEQYAEVALLRSLAVTDSGRGLGIGTALVRHAEGVALSRTARAVYLLTTTAERFFSNLGYHNLARDQAPPSVASTAEFSTLCPASSVLMQKVL